MNKLKIIVVLFLLSLTAIGQNAELTKEIKLVYEKGKLNSKIISSSIEENEKYEYVNDVNSSEVIKSKFFNNQWNIVSKTVKTKIQNQNESIVYNRIGTNWIPFHKEISNKLTRSKFNFNDKTQEWDLIYHWNEIPGLEKERSIEQRIKLNDLWLGSTIQYLKKVDNHVRLKSSINSKNESVPGTKHLTFFEGENKVVDKYNWNISSSLWEKECRAITKFDGKKVIEVLGQHWNQSEQNWQDYNTTLYTYDNHLLVEVLRKDWNSKTNLWEIQSSIIKQYENNRLSSEEHFIWNQSIQTAEKKTVSHFHFTNPYSSEGPIQINNLNDTKKYHFNIYNITGQLLFTQKIENTNNINVSYSMDSMFDSNIFFSLFDESQLIETKKVITINN